MFSFFIFSNTALAFIKKRFDFLYDFATTLLAILFRFTLLVIHHFHLNLLQFIVIVHMQAMLETPQTHQTVSDLQKAVQLH